MGAVVEQEVEVFVGWRSSLVVVVAVLAVAGSARAGYAEHAGAVECDTGKVFAVTPDGEEACTGVLIGLSASPNPTPPGGTVSFSATSYPWTDCWDNLDHSWWGDYAFSRSVDSPFTWTVYCMGNGIESNSLVIGVSSGGGGGGGGGALPAVISAPTVSGTPEVGQTLTAGRGSWTNSPTSYDYVWRRSGDLLELGRGPALALSSAHVGYKVRVDVQACNGTGCSTWASSGWTAAVTEQPPVYDSAYAEGSDTDEFFYTTICSGSSCPSALTTSPHGSTAAAVCARAGGYVTRTSAVTQVWRMRHELAFCADRNRITTVWDRVIDGQILVPSWMRTFYPWTWNTITDSPPAVNVYSSRSFARIRFEMCAVFRGIGPLCRSSEPWIEITLYGDGTAVCKSSSGRLRNCRTRL